MKRNFDRAMKLTAKLKAHAAYCQLHDVPDPDFSGLVVDPHVTEMHGQALAWAEQHWEDTLGEIDDEDRRFLMDVLTRTAGCCETQKDACMVSPRNHFQ